MIITVFLVDIISEARVFPALGKCVGDSFDVIALGSSPTERQILRYSPDEKPLDRRLNFVLYQPLNKYLYIKYIHIYTCDTTK